MARKLSQPSISVILPVYNAAAYLQRAFDSLIEQQITELEVVAVNDGSTDDSLAILRHLAAEHKVVIIDQSNQGQGYARNRAIERATGDYILFLDADDWLEPTALPSLLAATGHNDVDVVHCGWRAGNTGHAAHRPSYRPSEIFAAAELRGSACDEFLRLPNYFSVNNLYRRNFLLEQQIRFGEGYIYEDNEFMVAVANRAQLIRFVDESLYVINFHGESSTRGAFTTDKHYRDFMVAIRQSFAILHPRLPQSLAYLASYFLEKFIIYYQRRVPQQYKRAYARDFVDSMSGQEIISVSGTSVSKFLRLCLRLRIFKNRRYGLFAVCIFYKTRLLPLIKR